MKNLRTELTHLIEQGLQKLFGLEKAGTFTLQQTRKEFRGDYTLVVFPYVKDTRKSPEEIGTLLGGYVMERSPNVAHFNVVKGFLNLEISARRLQERFAEVANGQGFGAVSTQGERIMVEYSSPNTNKPLHLGHMRTNFLGYAVANLLKAVGNHVVMANLVNDRGIHICKSMVAYQAEGNGETPESTGLKGDKLVGKYYVRYDQLNKAEIASLVAKGMSDEAADRETSWFKKAQEMLRQWEAGDEDTLALWNKMNNWVYAGFELTYKRMGVHFDKFYYESDTYLLGKNIVDEGLASGVFYQKEDNSAWIDLTAEGLDHKLVRRGDGTSVYITQDLGTADLKYSDFNVKRSVYVVGNEQDYHFQVLFHILKRLGRPYADGLYHLSYGMVDLPSGKMKSREGTVVDADDLMNEMIETARDRTEELGKFDTMDEPTRNALYETLGIGAIKYFLLRVDPAKRMLFNPAESIDLHGNTATAIQYSHARVCSILRKAAEAGLTANVSNPLAQIAPEERELMLQLLMWGLTVEQAAAELAPSHIANYAYDLSRAFNKFFGSCSILSANTEEQKAFRLGLAEQTQKALQSAFGILGIGLPERM